MSTSPSIEKKLYLLNFSGPNFLARFATLFGELNDERIVTVDFNYQAHMGFGSGLLCLEASIEMKDNVLEHAKALDWKSSFVSSGLPDFYRAQNQNKESDVRFLLLDDQYDDVIMQLLDESGAVLETTDNVQKTRTVRLYKDRIDSPRWHFVCAESLGEAKEKLSKNPTDKCDLLLLDMKLDLNGKTSHEGIRFFDDLRAADQLLPIVVITQGTRASGQLTNWSPRIIQEYWSAGAWYFLYKANLFPRLLQIIDLLVDRNVEPLVVVVTSNDLSQDLAFLFRFLRDQPVKIVGASCVPGFQDLMLGPQPTSRNTRLVLEFVKHESISTNHIANTFYEMVNGDSNLDFEKRSVSNAREWIRFHHGKIYEEMQLS